jgi:SAM-dependent methyltransferase
MQHPEPPVSAFAFDELAADYDASFTRQPLGQVLRCLVRERVRAHFGSARRILDLGCGTGEDSLELASAGAQVCGVDVSAAMVRMARAKASAHPAGARVELHCAPMEQLDAVLGERRFDAVLSNFGALNCVADLSLLSEVVARHLQPGAPLLWVFLGRYVPWEWGWFLLRGQPRRAARRLGRAGAQWRGVHVRYPVPSQARTALLPHFDVEALRPLGWLLPPSYAGGWLGTRPRTLGALTRLERRGQGSAWLARFADHYIVEARRRPLPAVSVSRP